MFLLGKASAGWIMLVVNTGCTSMQILAGEDGWPACFFFFLLNWSWLKKEHVKKSMLTFHAGSQHVNYNIYWWPAILVFSAGSPFKVDIIMRFCISLTTLYGLCTCFSHPSTFNSYIVAICCYDYKIDNRFKLAKNSLSTFLFIE